MGTVVVHSGHIIELSDAVALLGDFPALAGLDLTVTKGEVVAIEGSNGAGKSTLLRLCAGLLPLHTGTGVILGKDLSNRSERRALRRDAGLLAHETFLYDELSIIDNITFWAKANRSDLSTIEPVLDRLGLDGRLRDVKARDLSAGQRRRTSLAIMVSRRPHIWLLDEPHAALDAKGKDAVDSLVRQAIGFGATVLLASHDLDRARAVATRVITVSGGRIVDMSASESPKSDGESETDELLASHVEPKTASSSRPLTKGFVNNPVVRVGEEPSTAESSADLGHRKASSVTVATAAPASEDETEPVELVAADPASEDETEPIELVAADPAPEDETEPIEIVAPVDDAPAGEDDDDSIDELFADLLGAEHPPSLFDSDDETVTGQSDGDTK